MIITDKLKAPNYIEKRIDIKRVTIISAAAAIKSLINDKTKILGPNTQVIVLTTSSMIYGQILIGDEDNTPAAAINKSIFDCRNKILENEQDKEDIVVNNSSIITIKNACIKPLVGGNPAKFELLNIFTDQILGFSFGELNQE